MPHLNVSRRQLIGLGAAAGAATVVGLTSHVPFASAADGDIGVTGRALPNYTAITQVAGLQTATLGYADFQAIGTGSSQGTKYADPPSVYNESGNSMQASLRMPVGSVLRKVDFFGFRGPAATGTMTFILYKTTVPTSATRNTLGSVNVPGTGEVQGVFDLGAGLTIGLGDVITIESPATNADNRVVGAIYQYAPAGGIYVPIAPKRVYDSRQGAAGKLGVGDPVRTVSVATEIGTGGATNVVPAGATGVAYNITITQTEKTFGYLTVVAGGAPTAGPSSINWDRENATVANGLQGPLNSAREISVFCGGDTGAKTHFLIDVLGYYL